MLEHSEMQNCTTEIFLLRHGECEGGNILRGHTDVALSPKGVQQMQGAAKSLIIEQSVIFDYIYSSPLIRCADFSQKLSTLHSISLKQSNALKEINFGDWDGQPFTDLYQTAESKIEAYWSDPWAITPPNGESMLEFENRINNFWSDLLAAHAGQKLLLITHAGVIRHLMAKALGISQAVGFYTQLSLPYASLVKITVFHSSEGHFTKLHWS